MRDWTPLTQSDLDMTKLVGTVEDVGDLILVKRPLNPTYYWGNFALVRRAPRHGDLDAWIERVRECFAESRHVMLRWDGDDVDPETRDAATRLGMTSDSGLEMSAIRLASGVDAEGVQIRPLDCVSERDRIVALNVACDPAEQSGSARYREFKVRSREDWWRYCETGRASWWGAFRGDELVAQCGLVSCSHGLARFQSVETHPEHRRRGICSMLIAHVGSDALQNRGSRRLLLGVDAEGPALALYRRLGFEIGGVQRSLLLGGSEMRVRLEVPADIPEVHSITKAAFQSIGESGATEVRILESLRERSEVLSLVADRSGTLLGHAFVTPLRVDEDARSLAALGPISVRPSQQRSGVGTALIEDAIRRCRERGVRALCVVGDPDYYARFGFEPASSFGMNSTFELPEGVFRVLPLVDDFRCEFPSGTLVHYDAAFSQN